MQIPDDVDRVGLVPVRARATRPAGAVVVAGHVDDAEQGLGALSGCPGRNRGDRVEVVLASGRKVAYTVTGRQLLPKQRLPLDKLLQGRRPPPRAHHLRRPVRRPVARHYRDNLVVRAERLP